MPKGDLEKGALMVRPLAAIFPKPLLCACRGWGQERTEGHTRDRDRRAAGRCLRVSGGSPPSCSALLSCCCPSGSSSPVLLTLPVVIRLIAAVVVVVLLLTPLPSGKWSSLPGARGPPFWCLLVHLKTDQVPLCHLTSPQRAGPNTLKGKV